MTLFLAGLLVGMALGTLYGFQSNNRYWRNRLRDRPETIHLGPHEDKQ